MPTHIYEQVALAHIKTAFYKTPGEEVLEKYMSPWQGERGQAAWYRKIGQFDEAVTDEIAQDLPGLEVPVQIIWGQHDAWLSEEIAREAHEAIPDSDLEFVAKAGHFSPEDNPEAVAQLLARFFRR